MKSATLAEHAVVTPRSLAEALAFLGAHADEGWTPLAGGTDLLVGMNAGVEARRRWIDLSRLEPELAAITMDDDGRVRVGGLATMTTVRQSDVLRRACPLAAEAAATVGAAQIQNRATVAGNVVNASPAGDTLPVWLAADAEVELASAAGVRRVPYRDFTPAYRTVVRRPDELVTAILVPPMPADAIVLFRKVGTRAAQAISKVVFAGVRRVGADGKHVDVRLAFGSMGPTPARAAAAEAAALGRPADAEHAAAAAAALGADLSPIDDVRSTAAYRRTVARHLVREFLAGNLGATLL